MLSSGTMGAISLPTAYRRKRKEIGPFQERETPLSGKKAVVSRIGTAEIRQPANDAARLSDSGGALINRSTFCD